MQPAKDIGGDFYDHFPLVDGRRGVVVADDSVTAVLSDRELLAAHRLELPWGFVVPAH